MGLCDVTYRVKISEKWFDEQLVHPVHGQIHWSTHPSILVLYSHSLRCFLFNRFAGRRCCLVASSSSLLLLLLLLLLTMMTMNVISLSSSSSLLLFLLLLLLFITNMKMPMILAVMIESLLEKKKIGNKFMSETVTIKSVLLRVRVGVLCGHAVHGGEHDGREEPSRY